MKSGSKETEIEFAIVEKNPELEIVLDKIEIRKIALGEAMAYWDKKVSLSTEENPIDYPAHIQTILDTAWYIEKFLGGDFKSD